MAFTENSSNTLKPCFLVLFRSLKFTEDDESQHLHHASHQAGCLVLIAAGTIAVQGRHARQIEVPASKCKSN